MSSKSFFYEKHPFRIATVFILSSAVGTPFTPLFNSNSEYLYPMELALSEDEVLNYYLNFVTQAVCFMFIVIFFLTNFLVFFIFSINVTYELKFIAQLANRFGDEKSIFKDNNIQTKPIKVLSKDVLKVINHEKNDLSGEEKSRILLKTVVKYHSNALS